jgi:WD40 repeat protein
VLFAARSCTALSCTAQYCFYNDCCFHSCHYRAGHNGHVRTLLGHVTDPFFQPRAAWDVSGRLVFCNSMGPHGLWVYDVASGRAVQKLTGHTGAVRDVTAHATARTVCTASYDKTVRVWSY